MYKKIFIILSATTGLQATLSEMPNGSIAKVGNILASVKNPEQLKMHSLFRKNLGYTKEIFDAFNRAGESLKTTTENLKGRPSLDLRPIERTIINRQSYAHLHPWRLAMKSGVIGAAITYGCMKADQTGYLDLPKAYATEFYAKYIEPKLPHAPYKG
jgi:hypothetical protein